MLLWDTNSWHFMTMRFGRVADWVRFWASYDSIAFINVFVHWRLRTQLFFEQLVILQTPGCWSFLVEAQLACECSKRNQGKKGARGFGLPYVNWWRQNIKRRPSLRIFIRSCTQDCGISYHSVKQWPTWIQVANHSSHGIPCRLSCWNLKLLPHGKRQSDHPWNGEVHTYFWIRKRSLEWPCGKSMSNSWAWTLLSLPSHWTFVSRPWMLPRFSLEGWPNFS